MLEFSFFFYKLGIRKIKYLSRRCERINGVTLTLILALVYCFSLFFFFFAQRETHTATILSICENKTCARLKVNVLLGGDIKGLFFCLGNY